MKIKLVTIVADPTFRRGLNMLLREISDVEIVAELFECKGVMEINPKPDVIILDTFSNLKEGLNDAKSLVENFPGSKVVFLTHHEASATQTISRLSGVHALLIKPFTLRELTCAIEGLFMESPGKSSPITR